MTISIAQNELLFKITYQILLNKEQGYLSAAQLASHYKHKVKRKIKKKSFDELSEEMLNAEVIIINDKKGVDEIVNSFSYSYWNQNSCTT